MTQKQSAKKKILYIITKGNFGGAQRYVFDLATHLPTNTYEAIVACGDQDGDMLKHKLEGAGIRTVTLLGSGREIKTTSDFSVLKQIISLIKTEQPNVVHLNSSKIGFLGVVATLYIKLFSLFDKTQRVPLCIFTAHGWAFNEKNRSGLWKFIYWCSYYVTILGCDIATAVSEKTKKDISFLPFLTNKIQVIHNGTDSFNTLPRNEARELIQAKNITICSIGELHPSKGYSFALRAIAQLPTEVREKISYRIIGGGEKKEWLTKLIEELNLQNTVTLLGPIDNAKQLLSGVDVFLLSSRNENLPYALLEAGFAGVPIISTSVGGIPEIITDMKDGILVHKENPKEIAEGIMYILEHPEKQKEFGNAIQEVIASEFSLSTMLKKTTALYSSNLKAPSSSL